MLFVPYKPSYICEKYAKYLWYKKLNKYGGKLKYPNTCLEKDDGWQSMSNN